MNATRRSARARARTTGVARPAHLITHVQGHVAGDVRTVRGVWSGQRRNRRDLLIYLPPSYASSTRRYPVLYMHDGQNLFDEATSYAGEWHVDETMEDLSRTGLEAIVVGVPNMHQQRAEEYSPFPDARLGIDGRGDDYLAFLIDTVKPLVDAEFRTEPDRASTGIAGSSLGGLISLYAFFRAPDAFGFAGVVSPALWPGARAIFPLLEQTPYVAGRLYVDIGTAELPGALLDAQHLDRLLRAKGYGRAADYCYLEDDGAGHHETAWARRFRAMATFLFGHGAGR